jgi:hypothetical protein
MRRDTNELADLRLKQVVSFIVHRWTLLALALTEIAWLVANLAAADRALDPPPFHLLGRLNAVLACCVVTVGWANGRRLLREARATDVPMLSQAPLDERTPELRTGGPSARTRESRDTVDHGWN